MTTPTICGRHPTLPATTHGGCGRELNPGEVYRCTDCTTPFHRECAMLHFIHNTEGPERHARRDVLELAAYLTTLAVAGSNVGHRLREHLVGHEENCECPSCGMLRRFRRLADPANWPSGWGTS